MSTSLKHRKLLKQKVRHRYRQLKKIIKLSYINCALYLKDISVLILIMILLTFTLELQILWNKKENTIPIWKLLKLFYWLYGCQTTINLKSQLWLITKFKTNEYFWLWQEPNEAQFYDCLSILCKALREFRIDFKTDKNQHIHTVSLSEYNISSSKEEL